MTEPPVESTVLDTTALSNFAHVDALALLLAVPRIVTVPAVQSELEAGAETHPYLRDALSILGDEIPVYALNSPAREVEAEVLAALDPGEAQALAVAELTGGVLVTDDGDARHVARARDVDLTGSIGLLVRFVETDELSTSRADAYLKRWIDEAGFRSPARDINAFLE